MKRVIALGFFDGVHLGHGRLLSLARSRADVLEAAAAGLTFDSHPDTLVTGAAVPLLSGREDRETLMKSLYGMDEVLTLHFDEAMRDMPWESFLDRILIQELGACCLICGHDFRFGAGGKGTAEALTEACKARGIECHVVPAYKLDGITVSSTYIRGLIQGGQMERAEAFLGHPHILSGPVVHGAEIGRTMEIPTANLAYPKDILLPARGVYACRAIWENETHLAVANVGLRPTVGGESVTVEPWLLDFSGDLYGKTLRLEFWKFLRPEKKFPSLEALRQEILRNAEQTRQFFAEKS